MNSNNKKSGASKKKAPKSQKAIDNSSLSKFSSNLSRTEPIRSVPMAMGSVKNTGRPKITSMQAGKTRITHREYIQDVKMSPAFLPKTFVMNPGNGLTFPWLSQIATRFESYKFNELRFCFETSASSSETGTVMLVPDYDSLDAQPLNKSQALSYKSSARAQAWLSFCQESSKEDLHKLKSHYVLSGSVPTGTDARLYNIGNMFLCVQGSDANTVGELWVEYDVELSTPQIEGTNLAGKIVSSGTVNPSAVFGTSPIQTGNFPVSVGSSVLTFTQAAQCLVILQATGTGLSGFTTTGSTAQNTILADNVATGALLEEVVINVNAAAGDSLVFVTSPTTLTATVTRIGLYTYALA